MLESLAASVLNRVLGSYVQNFDPAQLNVGIWSGDVKLKNLKLRQDCLDSLNLPIDVKFGVLNDLSLVVPWSSLKNNPVKIIIEDCFLLCTPRDFKTTTPDEDIARELRHKLNKLAEWELTNQAKQSLSADNADDGKNSTFMQSLTTKIIENLQITIKNIHLRYEDKSCLFSKYPCALGVALKEFSAVSTDDQWVPKFIETAQALSHKLFKMDSLCCYWNTNSTFLLDYLDPESELYDPTHEKLILQFQRTIASAESAETPQHQYIIRPISGEGHLTLNKKGSSDSQPHVDMQLIFEEFTVGIDDAEYNDFLFTLSNLTAKANKSISQVERPSVSVQENPQEWFKYVVSRVKERMRKKNEMWTWDAIQKKCQDRRKYIELWEKKLNLPSLESDLPIEEEAKLNELTESLSYEELILFRTVAKRQFTESRAVSKASNKAIENSKNNNGGWLSSWWGSKDTTSDALELTDEQRKEFYDAIEFDENEEETEEISVPRERVTLNISSILKKGSFVLKKKNNVILSEVIFEDCELQFSQRSDSYIGKFSLADFRVEDGSETSIYKHIVSGRDLHKSSITDTGDIKENLLNLIYESNPLDGISDSKLDIKLNGMTIFYNVLFVSEILQFFNMPDEHKDTIDAIISAAEATVEGWTTYSRMGIETILEDHKTINLSLDLQAPLIILPLHDYTWDTPCAIVDAGHISVSSDVIPKEKIKEIISMSPEDYDKLNPNDKNRLMFDRYKLELQDTQILVGANIHNTLSSLKDSESLENLSVLEKMKLVLVLDSLIAPKAFRLPKFKLTGHLPTIRFAFNDFQYKTAIEILQNCLPSSFIIENNDGTQNTPEENATRFSDLEQKQLRDMKAYIATLSESQLDQKFLDVHFDIDQVMVGISKCENSETMTCNKLVDIKGENFQFDFYKRTKDMKVNLQIHSLNMEDHISKSSKEFSNLITSEFSGSVKNSDLFSLQYSRTQRIVSHENSLIEVYDQDVLIDMEKLQIVLTPLSILTLMNFMMLTFSDPNAPEAPADVLRHNNSDNEDAPQKIKMKINMGGVNVILNDDSIKIATLVFNAANLKLVMLPEKLKFDMRMDGLDLTEEISEALDRCSPLRKLIQMEGDELVELSYETFDSQTNSANFDSLLKYTTGSMVINFVEAPINRIANYLNKFQKMKTFFDRAREAAYNQAPSMDTVNNMKLDILIKSPTINFPNTSNLDSLGDRIQLFLGEFFIQNSFTGETSQNKVNHVKMGLRQTELISYTQNEKVSILHGMSLLFSIIHSPLSVKDEPTFKIISDFNPTTIAISEHQANELLKCWSTFSNAFTIENDNEDQLYLMVNSTPSVESVLTTTPSTADNALKDSDGEELGDKIKFDFVFNSPSLSLVLSDSSSREKTSNGLIAEFGLQDMGTSFKLGYDGTLDGEAHISAFTVKDKRSDKQNKFAELVPKSNENDYQFVAKYSTRKLSDHTVTNVSTNINSPHVILAMDFLFALKNFVGGLNFEEPTVQLETDDSSINSDIISESNEPSPETKNVIQYSLNIVDTAFILLADPSNENTEAVVFNIGQILLTDQNIISFATNNVNVFLTQMNTNSSDKVRLLDDFSTTLTIDKRESTKNLQVTDIQISIQPLLMRISLRDIRLAMMIFERTIALANNSKIDIEVQNEESGDKIEAFSKEFEKKLSKYVPSILSTLSDTQSLKRATSRRSASPIRMQIKESLSADFGGLRLILIGDVHEMPVLDMSATSLFVSGKNWSSNLKIETSVTTYVNIFNYSRSCWEPFIENTNFIISFLKKSNTSSGYELNVNSDVLTDITLSTRSLEMLTGIPKALSGELALKPRGYQKPYRLVNQTGLDIDVWILTDNIEDRKGLTRLENEGNIPWEFEDWQSVRERLSTDQVSSVICASIPNSNYKSILKVDATDIGDNIHVLKPSVGKYHNRIITTCDCGPDNIKTITFRSTLVVENITRQKVLVSVNPPQNSKREYLEFSILPNEVKSIPVEYCYDSNLKIKPAAISNDNGFNWSSENIYWKTLINGSRSVSCQSQNNDGSDYNFEVSGFFDNNEPLSKVYPKMKIVISPSLIIENGLPYDINFLLYERKDMRGGYRYLKRESSLEIHDVSLRNFVLMRVLPLIENDNLSKPTIIHTPPNNTLQPEKSIHLTLASGQKLRLLIHYQNLDGTPTKILKIYSPYILFNKTDRELFAKSDMMNVAKSTVYDSDNGRFSKPLLFSFEKPSEKNNKAQIKFRESDWCLPFSIDAIGQAFDTSVPVPNKEQEFDVGIYISDGVGPYMLSKIVEVAPRYIIRNELDYEIEVCEVGSIDSIQIPKNESKPLYKLSSMVEKQLILKFLGMDSEWSAPFHLNEVGSTFLKVLRKGSSHKLLKIDILLENATLFIVVKDGKNHWPYSIRNFSDYEFIFYQRDPSLIDDLYDEKNEDYEALTYKPLYYRIPPMSVMPYAWDYPSAKQKKLIITSKNRNREIDLGAIGNLKPMRLPGVDEGEKMHLVDLHVVADGPTQALLITNYNPEVSLYKLRNKKKASSLSLNESGEVFVADENDEEFQTRLVFSFNGIGVSLIDANLREILYLNMQGIEMRYNESDLYKTFSWNIKWLQADNQLFTSNSQNIIYPTTVKKTEEELKEHPVLSGSISKVKDDSHGIPYYKHVTLLMQELSIQLDEDFMYAILEFSRFPGAPWITEPKIPDMDHVRLPEFEDITSEDDLYFEVLHIQPTMLHFSFSRSDRIEETKDVIISDTNKNSVSPMYYVHMLSLTLGNVNDAPIKLNSLLMDNVRVPLPMLMNSMKMYYGQQVFYQVHKILGSADCFGNPVGLFNTISSGVVDLFYEPYLGYMMNDSPQEIGAQIARGGVSFAKKTVYGLSDSMARLTGSLAKGLSVTQDSSFQESRRLQQRLNRSGKNVFANSAQSFAATIGSGFSGIALDPYKGAQKDGAAGLIKGLGKGLLGLPAKTAIGFLDLTSNLSQGLRVSTNDIMAYQARIRLPRYIGNDQIIKPYDESHSLGQYWLKTVNGGQFVDDEYLAHVILPGNELVVIVSMQRICELNIKELEVMWGVEYDSIQGIVLERGGIHVKLKSQAEYFIPIADPHERRYIYKNIAIAVKKYNQYCEVVL